MVGTKPVERPSPRAWRATCFIHSMVWMVSKGLVAQPFYAEHVNGSLEGSRRSWLPLTVREKSALRDSCPLRRGQFAIVHDQVRGGRLCAKLPQKSGDLPAMVGG